jgi:E-phenylitaconyl-CoA hydratase
MGLISQVVPESELTQVTYTMAKEIAQNAPLSIRAMKKIISWLMDREIPPAIQKQLVELKTVIFRSHDCREGQQAFLESRSPVFTGK